MKCLNMQFVNNYSFAGPISDDDALQGGRMTKDEWLEVASDFIGDNNPTDFHILNCPGWIDQAIKYAGGTMNQRILAPGIAYLAKAHHDAIRRIAGYPDCMGLWYGCKECPGLKECKSQYDEDAEEEREVYLA